MITNNRAGRVCSLGAAVILGSGGVAGAQTVHHHGFVHRHAGAVAGVAAYAAARHTGHRRMAAGRHRNFAQRHPVLTGVAAGAAAHHLAKKH